MKFDTVTELSDLAEQVYRAESATRVVDAEIDEIRFSAYPLNIPETMMPRVVPAHSFIAAEKVEKGKDLLGDGEEAKVAISQLGTTNKAEREREIVQNWDQAFLQQIEHQPDGRRLSDMLKDDALTRSRIGIKVLPDPLVWKGIKDAKLPEALDSAFGTDDAMEAVNATIARQDEARARHVPILAEWVPAACLVPENDRYGLSCMWEFRELSVRRVLADYRDAHGKPLAKELARQVDGQSTTLTERDVCTVVTRCDRTHMVVAVVGMRLDSSDGTAWSSSGTDEIIWQGEHGLSRVPYAFKPARMTNSAHGGRKYWGLLHPVISDIRQYDNFRTQRGSSIYQSVWPGMMLLKSDKTEAVTTGDRPSELVMDEGGITDGLGPGERLEPIQWMPAGSIADLNETLRDYEQTINRKTIGMASYGAGGADSGYLQSQLQAASETALEAAERAINAVLAETLSLAHECAAVMMSDRFTDDGGIGPIPARYADAEGAKFVTLKPEHVDHEWDIRVAIRSKPLGGEMAQFQTVDAMVKAGYISLQDGQERMGIRNPGRERQRIMQERIIAGQNILEMAQKYVADQAMKELQQAIAPPVPQDAAISGALAAQLTDPSLTGLLPLDQGGGGPPIAGLPGLPNMTAQGALPPAATPSTAQQDAQARQGAGGGIPGNPVGAAQSMPGGMARMDTLNALR